MDALQFIAAMAAALAWPSIIVAVLITFHAPIKQLLIGLTKVKYKDFELDFGRELKELGEKAKAIDVKPAIRSRSMTPERKESMQLISEAERLAEDFPAPAISVGWSAVEDELRSTVMNMAISPDSPTANSAIKNADLLAEQKLIDRQALEVIATMRRLRNLAVHQHEIDENITTDQALEFIRLAKGIIEKLRGIRRT